MEGFWTNWRALGSLDSTFKEHVCTGLPPGSALSVARKLLKLLLSFALLPWCMPQSELSEYLNPVHSTLHFSTGSMAMEHKGNLVQSQPLGSSGLFFFFFFLNSFQAEYQMHLRTLIAAGPPQLIDKYTQRVHAVPSCPAVQLHNREKLVRAGRCGQP